MRIGVIADTHIPVAAKKIPKQVLKLLEGAELILHAGDILQLEVIEELNQVAETLAVRGNMDYFEVIERLPDQKIIQVKQFKIGLIHGAGSPQGLILRLKEKLPDADCVVYGHTHIASIDKINGVLFFNPGSPTDKVFAPYNSIGILKVEEEIRAEIVRL